MNLCASVQLHVWGHGSYCVYEILYTSMYQECVCSFNYAAMYNLVCYLNSTSTVHWFSPCVCCCTLIAKGASILSIEYSIPFPPNEWNEKSLLPLLQAAVPFSSFVILGGSLRKKCQILTPWPDFYYFQFCCKRNLSLQLAISKKKVQYHTSSLAILAFQSVIWVLILLVFPLHFQ